ncbi:MAG: outer membrane beta-barrel protein [Hyphomicrobiales bacterium]
MKKLLLALTLAAGLMPVASAVAADLDIPPPPVQELRPAQYDWSGFYLGGWAGSTCVDGTLTDNSAPADWDMAGCGWKGGVMGGYNQQFDQWVVGLEGDWGTSGKIVQNDETGADFAFKTKQIATLRVRSGIAFDDTLLFATAGGAWAQGDLVGTNLGGPENMNSNHWGWSWGFGAEQAITDQIRLKLDYLHTAFNGGHYSSPCGACDVDIHKFDDNEVRLGVIWAF